jgi:threonine dehydrogenase-like Zn-dependent dehydrogenase
VRIAVLSAPGRFDVAEEPPTPIGPGEVRLRVASCGVCTSELDIYRGASGHATFPWYPGHEVAGVVDEVGAGVEDVLLGDHVAAWVTERGFGQEVTVLAEHCVPAGDVPLDLALAEPLACAVNAVDLTDVALADDVVIVGAGFMGLLAQRGPRHLVVADVRDEALERARSFGATHVVNVADEDAAGVVAELTDGRGVDVAIEATGTQAALTLVGDVTRMSGTVTIAGYHQGEPRQLDLAAWNWKAFRVANAHFRDVGVIMHGMRRASRLLVSKQISMEGLVTHRFPLERIDDAFGTAVEKPAGFVKAVVLP